MCYGDDAHPPLPPVRGGAGDYGDLELTASDGNRLAAYFAHPDAPSTAGMIVLPDVRGLHGFYKELARRFAEAGMHSVAIDYFGRTAEDSSRDEGFDFRAHIEKMTPAGIDADVQAAADWLRSDAGGAVSSVFTVGFCMGGAISWGQSASSVGLAGAAGFYGMPSRVRDRIPQMTAPLLLLAAGRDFTPVEEVEAFSRDLTAAGVENELQVYPDAPHSFFDRSFAEHEAACDDAWRRILAFVEVHSA